MTSSLFRFGTQLEARVGTQTLWNSGKRKRGNWTCADCRSRGSLRQRRQYSDDSIGIGSAGYGLLQRQDGVDDEPNVRARRAETPRVEPSRAKTIGWGLSTSGVAAQGAAKTEAWELDGDFSPVSSTSAPTSRAEAYAAREEEQENLWEQFERADEDANAVPRSLEDDARTVSRSEYQSPYDTAQDIDYATELPRALRERNSDSVARCLVVAERASDLEFIRSLSQSTMTECIQLLQPCHMTERLASVHFEIGGAIAKAMGVASMRRIAWEHTRMLETILTIRRATGMRLCLEDYRMLLQAARDLGHRMMAVRVWTHLKNDQLTPDLTCYNNYMGATIMNGMFNSSARHSVRITPFNMLGRRSTKLGERFANFRIGKKGIKAEILKVFGEMLQRGIFADEESFRLVITGAAREGDLDTVKGILKRVWNVDVDALLSGTETAVAPKKMDTTSPLYPSSKMLWTLAHAFGINNDIPAALRVVDLFARHFNIPIDRQTWAQLFEWTFVLATHRTGKKTAHDGSRTGQLPLPSVLSLWDTMTSAPYFVEPTMGMYNYLIRNLQQRDMVDVLVGKMYDGRKLYKAGRQLEKAAWRRMADALRFKSEESQVSSEKGAFDTATPTSASPSQLESLRREWEYHRLICHRNVFWLQRWLRKLLTLSRSRIQIDHSGDWTVRHIPHILWAWRRHAPTVVRYETPTGSVSLRFRTEEEIEANGESTRVRLEGKGKVLDQIPLALGDWYVRRRNTRERVEEAKDEPRLEKWD